MQDYHYYAFFDVDETLITQNSMMGFLRFFARQKKKKIRFFVFLSALKICTRLQLPRETICKLYYMFYKKTFLDELMQQGKNWFSSLEHETDFFFKPILHEIETHKNKGGAIVFVSGSFLPCLLPLSEKVKADFILCTQLESKNNVCTGRVLGRPVIGEEKARQILQFLKERQFQNLSLCFSYGDHASDLPMLSLVGHPRAVSCGKCNSLLDHAKKQGWLIL